MYFRIDGTMTFCSWRDVLQTLRPASPRIQLSVAKRCASLLFLGLALGFSQLAGAADDRIAGQSNDGSAKPHVVIVVGTLHYSPELSMPIFARKLEQFGFRTTVIKGEGNPERKTEDVLPGIEALDKADLAIFFIRFLKLPDDEWRPIERYIKSGKPVIGLRTANHGFKYPKGHPRFEWNDGFGRRVLGTPYVVHQTSETQVSVVDSAQEHPIMANVGKKSWVSPGTLYLTRLEDGCKPLVTGTGKGKVRTIKRAFGTVEVNEHETDVVAWVWENEWGAKVFSTSFGHPGDFAEESFVRMLVNSICWSLDRPLPPANAAMPTFALKRADK